MDKKKRNKPVGDKANKRHIAFAEEYLANGMNGTQAYKTIYPKASDETARANATKLLASTHIAQFLATQKKNTSTRLQVTKESLINDLMVIKDLCLTEPRYINNSIKAIEVINKMLGYNEVEKTEVKHTWEVGFNEE